MTDLAAGLMVISVAAPLVTALCGLILVGIRRQWAGHASSLAHVGIASSFLSSSGLVAVFVVGHRTRVFSRLGTWFDLSGVRHLSVEWGLHVDQFASVWLSVLSGLAWLTVSRVRRSPKDSNEAFVVSTGLVLSATIGFVLSTSLIQMLSCWTLISMATLAMVGWTSSSGTAVQGMRRAIQTGLPGDLLLLWGVLLIGLASGTDSVVDATSAAGLTRMGTGNLAFPGLIGCLLVLSVLGRCGLFPCFGWHYEAAAWDERICTVIYGIGYVPSAIWVLIKCQPLLVTSEVPVLLLGGLGTLGAVLGAFVACGQTEPRRRIAYLLASQNGLMLAALGSGLARAVPVCIWHQCAVSIATYVLFANSQTSQQTRRVPVAAAWCAGLVVAGLLPIAGWGHRELIELNGRPLSWTLTDDEDVDRMADATQPANMTQSPIRDDGAPRWGWICGLCFAQSLSAFAVVRVVQGGSIRSQQPPLPIDRAAVAAATLLVIAGLCGWYLGAVAIPTGADQWTRFLIAESVLLVAIFTGYRSTERAAVNGKPHVRWEPLLRLSQQRLYVDQMFQLILEGPFKTGLQLLARLFDPAAIDRAWSRLMFRSMAWLGTYAESLQVSRADFYVATILIGTATLLLTLIVMG